ncbi:hypothetical protein GX586_13360 [bacterium]|nr:hypothetical protein [bacterium]
MTSRERILAALNHRQPDRVPVDVGTQASQFCSPETFDELYAPYYRRLTGWIHAHTGWRTFKHSCGAVEPLITRFITAGFDVLNPVQCSAAGMEPRMLKQRYGDRLTFWGGGFVFNAVHNVQATTPVENIVAMIDAVKEFNA